MNETFSKSGKYLKSQNKSDFDVFDFRLRGLANLNQTITVEKLNKNSCLRNLIIKIYVITYVPNNLIAIWQAN